MSRLFLSIFIFCTLATVPAEDFGPLKLDWDSCFLASPDESSSFLALTALTSTYGYQSEIKGKQLSLKFHFTADIDRAKSWVKRDKIQDVKMSRQLLNHEQGHVNINYLLMRELERKLTHKKYSLHGYANEIKNTADQTQRFYDEMQIRYDKETGHGINNLVQQQWDTRVGRALTELQ